MDTTIDSSMPEPTDAEWEKMAQAEERFALLGQRLGKKLANWQKEVRLLLLLGNESARYRDAQADAVDAFLDMAENAEFVHLLRRQSEANKTAHAGQYGRLSRKALGLKSRKGKC